MMKELNSILGIETKLSTAFHPQTDGQIENESGIRTVPEILYRL